MAITDIDDLPDQVFVGQPGHDNFHDSIHRGIKSLKALTLPTVAATVTLSTNETIDGVKTFSQAPVLTSSSAGSTQMVDKAAIDTAYWTVENSIPMGSNNTYYYRGDKTWQLLNKSAIALGNVSNTSDSAKPISTLQNAALATKEPSITIGSSTQYYVGTKTMVTLDKVEAGLSDVDNTSDLSKPVSTAVTSALSLKQDSITAPGSTQYYRGDKTWQTLTKTTAGLGSVDNTSDLNKPISSPQQTALNGKASISETLLLTGNQSLDGIKTFTSPPKLVGSTTVGHVWVATSINGSGSWQPCPAPITIVDYANTTTGRPSTFPPIIGTTSITAAAGNHTHTKFNIGLGNLDNTSDVNKPISTLTQNGLNLLIPESRSVSTPGALSGGGDLSTDRTISLDPETIGLDHLSSEVNKEGISYTCTNGTREVGYGQVPDGLLIPYEMRVVYIRFRSGTLDGSGYTRAELRRNGVPVPDTNIEVILLTTPITGSWTFDAGDILTVYITQVGGTPGKRLTADIVAERFEWT